MTLSLVVHEYDPRAQEAETEGSLQIQGQPGLYNEFKAFKLHSEVLFQKEGYLNEVELTTMYYTIKFLSIF